MQEYRSNSRKSKELEKENAAAPATTEKRVTKVITGAKTRDNKVRKFADTFISEDAANVKSYIFMDVLVPAIKKAISDIVTDGIDMILYGGTGKHRGKSSGSASRVSYRSYYDDKRDDRRDRDYDAPRRRFDYDDIEFRTIRQAEDALREMMDIIDRYGFVTVMDMFEIADLSDRAPYTAANYGWVNLRNARPERVRGGGYILSLPKASPID